MERPSNRSYSLRGDRMTRAQSLAMRQYWDQYSLSAGQELILNQIFPQKERVILEIGSGMGEATAQIAASSADTGYLAVEMHSAGLAALLLLIVEKQLTNIKMIREDATYLLANYIPDNSVDGIHLLFPDPWPKNRQHKRRIVQSEFVEMAGNKLKPNGFIHIATDWVAYAEWSQGKFGSDSRFTGGVIPKPDFRPLTRFEGKGLGKGHIVTDLKYVKS